MKIVVVQKNNDIIEGLAGAFATINEQVIVWSPLQRSALDMFDELKPDIFICEGIDIDEGIRIGLNDYQHTKLVLFGMSAPNDVNPSLMCFPSQLNKEQASLLNTKGLPAVQLGVAANLAKFCRGKYVPSYASDLLYISDIQWMGTAIPSVIERLIQYRLKIVGPHRMPYPEYVGTCSLPTLCDIMKSTTIGFDFTNKHIYDYAINKVFCISTEHSEFCPQLQSIDEIGKYIGAEKLRKKHIKEAYKYVKDHTYFHRAAEVCKMLELPEISERLITVVKSILAEGNDA